MDAFKEVISIFSGLILLAIIATLISKNGNTQGILSTSFSGLSQAVTAAEAPVTGGSGLNLGTSNLTNVGNGNY